MSSIDGYAGTSTSASSSSSRFSRASGLTLPAFCPLGRCAKRHKGMQVQAPKVKTATAVFPGDNKDDMASWQRPTTNRRRAGLGAGLEARVCCWCARGWLAVKCVARRGQGRSWKKLGQQQHQTKVDVDVERLMAPPRSSFKRQYLASRQRRVRPISSHGGVDTLPLHAAQQAEQAEQQAAAFKTQVLLLTRGGAAAKRSRSRAGSSSRSRSKASQVELH